MTIAIKYGFSKNLPLETLFSENKKIKKNRGEIRNFKSLQAKSPTIALNISIPAPISSIEKVWETREIRKTIAGYILLFRNFLL